MSDLLALSRAIEARDPHSAGHAARVGVMAEVVAERLGWDEADVDVLRMCAALHDVGKLRVPERILLKPGPLDADELAEMRRHPEEGARMVAKVRSLRLAVPGVLYHHERWDGSGYPVGVEGEAIPAEARVLAVVDSFDAMTSDRPYRRAMTEQLAVAELERCAGSQFDPDVVRVFAEAWHDGSLADATQDMVRAATG
ncbi:MAG TPA: HD-GYP domain-containing protein [Gaiellaceae bacterium]|jgi:putative nucleotidyltransferase with HDIG domain|nr:HD-GYP domain-containing protein [Gaiellaceae bacterium]